MIGCPGCPSLRHPPLIGDSAAALCGAGSAPVGCLWWGCGVADPAGSARTMGTRDDEYDYLFKGAVGGTQTGEGMAARQRAGGLRLRSRPLGPGRSPSLGARRLGSREGRGSLGSASFGLECAAVRSGRPREAWGPWMRRGGAGARRGWGPKRWERPLGAEPLGGGASPAFGGPGWVTSGLRAGGGASGGVAKGRRACPRSGLGLGARGWGSRRVGGACPDWWQLAWGRGPESERTRGAEMCDGGDPGLGADPELCGGAPGVGGGVCVLGSGDNSHLLFSVDPETETQRDRAHLKNVGAGFEPRSAVGFSLADHLPPHLRPHGPGFGQPAAG